ncbi:MAG: hypothetical protein AAB513_03475 [Patescibacteria group bacterium]
MSAMKAAQNKPLTHSGEFELFYGFYLLASRRTPDGLKVVFMTKARSRRKGKPTKKGLFVVLNNSPLSTGVIFQVNGVSRKKCGKEMKRLGFHLVKGDSHWGEFHASSRKVSRNHPSHDARNKLIDKWVKGKVDTITC